MGHTILTPKFHVSWVIPDGASNDEWVWEVLNGGPAQTIPPSFKQGVDLGTLKTHSYLWKVNDDQGPIKSMSNATKPVSCCSVLKLWQRLIHEFLGI
ncbi:hypothetical protein LguiB_027337 [Lonicera macranthoides]